MQNLCDRLIDTLKNFNQSLGDIRLSSAVYKNGDVEVVFVSDLSVSSQDKNFIKDKLAEELPCLNISVSVHKSVADADIAKRAVLDYLKTNCFSVAHSINDNSVNVISGSKKIKYELLVSDTIFDYLNRTDVINSMNGYLMRKYSNDFEGEVKILFNDTDIPSYKPDSVNVDDVKDVLIRTVKMIDVTKFSDDEIYDTATYIADSDCALGKAYFAGKVIDLEERLSKKGNKYYRITLDDYSGKLTANYFTADKNKLAKLEKLSVGSVIITRGEVEMFNDRPSYTIKGWHFCEFPNGYKPEKRPSKKPPEKYTFAFPCPCETSSQSDFFTKVQKLPDSLINNEFVVVDIETTGTDITSDKITEIGAVRIKNGVIIESFQTLVDPGVSLSNKIVELTGITDDMLKGQPKIEEVYQDFFKFLGDAVFVAHNADFDYRFLKTAGKAQGYFLSNECEDTLLISRQKLPWLSNHKLNTVCAHFNIEFRHHRALSDAFATAEAFIELSKL